MELTLETPVQYIPRVGPAMAARLKNLHIHSVKDFLYHIPFRYNDFSLVSPISRVQPGETVTVTGTVKDIKTFVTKNQKRVQQAKIADNTGTLTIVWFNQPYLIRIIAPGDTLRVSGTINWFGQKIVMSSPQYEILSEEIGESQSLHTGRLVPVYSETEGVSSKWLRGRIAYLLEHAASHLVDEIPSNIQEKFHLMTLRDALQEIHFPQSLTSAKDARRKLAFDELFFLQLRAYEQKRLWDTTQTSYMMNIPGDDIQSLIGTLPFSLTIDQKQTLEEIFSDLARPIPMNRLLEGDVGAGKTVVAAIAMYVAYRNGLSCLLMAPTQILAEQHYQTISQLLRPAGIRVDLVTGEKKSLPKALSQTPLFKTTSLAPSLVVGTHALLSASIRVKKLGLVVIDEQHRFGVAQRALLLSKNERKTPHLLTMTATPIPRTMARTIFGNLDLSVLTHLPSGRQRVKTWVVPTEKRDKAYQWIGKQIRDTGGQAFIVCPLIEESETLITAKAVTTEHQRLKKIFPHLRLGLLHGRLKPQEKSDVLETFRQKKYDILVTTPVVEVGIDIPNATIMMIEASERFGLGQLHQLRGRVGRGALTSYCLLFTEATEEQALQRIKAMETIFSGPELADVDLELRGPGELFGIRQHGVPDLKIATFTDSQTIAQTKKAVEALAQMSSDLSLFPLLREKLKTSTIEAVSQD